MQGWMMSASGARALKAGLLRATRQGIEQQVPPVRRWRWAKVIQARPAQAADSPSCGRLRLYSMGNHCPGPAADSSSCAQQVAHLRSQAHI